MAEVVQGDFISQDGDVSLVANRQGFTDTVRQEFSLGNRTGVFWGSDQNLYTSDNGAGAVKRHKKFSGTVLTTLSITTPARITMDNHGNLYVGLTNGTTTKYNGFSTNIIKTIALADVRGLSWQMGEADQNLINNDGGDDTFERMVGFSTDVEASISRGSNTGGPAWSRERNIAAATGGNPNLYSVYKGFTTTSTATWSEVGWTGKTEMDFVKVYPTLRKTVNF